MEKELEISIQDIPASDGVKELIQKKAAKLEKFCPEMISCRVKIQSPHKGHRTGNQYRVSINIGVPGADLAVNQEEQDVAANEDIRVTINRAFQKAERQLETYHQRRRRLVKVHEAPQYARIKSVSVENGSGLLETVDGRNISFAADDVLDGAFSRLREGVEVRFAERTDDARTRAEAIMPID